MLALSVSSVSAALVGTNGSFEAGTAPGGFLTVAAAGTDITDWAVDSGSVDYIGTYWQSSNGERNVDLNGLSAGSISHTFGTVAGATYDVTFDLSGNPDSIGDVDNPYYSPSLKSVLVSATGAVSSPFTFDTVAMGNSHGNMMWTPKSYSFVATGTSTTLTFASQIAGAFGPALDNVVINETLPALTANNCKKNGWKTMNDGANMFKNQGDCVSFFSTNGKNMGAGASIPLSI